MNVCTPAGQQQKGQDDSNQGQDRQHDTDDEIKRWQKGEKRKQDVKYEKRQGDKITKIKQERQKQQMVTKSHFIKLYTGCFFTEFYDLVNWLNASCKLQNELFASGF